MSKGERLHGDENEWVEWRIQRVSAKKQAGIDVELDPRHKPEEEIRTKAANTTRGETLTMKTPKIIKLLLILAGFAALATPYSYCQSDAFPDQFDAPNTEPFSQPKTKEADAAKRGKMRFDGKVILPYTVMCAEKRLPPGRYTISLWSDGKTGRATLHQRSQSLEIASTVRTSADPNARNILLVECLGKAHRLSAIHGNEMELVFDSNPQAGRRSDGKPQRTEKLPLIRTNLQK
jgi:hypothetical protein